MEMESVEAEEEVAVKDAIGDDEAVGNAAGNEGTKEVRHETVFSTQGQALLGIIWVYVHFQGPLPVQVLTQPNILKVSKGYHYTYITTALIT